MAICTYDTAARVLLFYCYYLEFYSTPGTGILMHGKCDMIFFFVQGGLEKSRNMWMLLYVQRGFHARELWANAVDENLVFLNHPFAIHKTLCKSILHMCKLFLSCAYQTTYLTAAAIIRVRQKKNKTTKNILCNLTSTKNQNESKQLCTHSLQCCLTNLNVRTGQLAKIDAHWILTAIAVSTRKDSGFKEVFFCCFLFFSLRRKRCGFDAAAYGAACFPVYTRNWVCNEGPVNLWWCGQKGLQYRRRN